ncbi:Hypothetical predicted protein [Marmota monax]|uniref:Peptidase A1 domain-containing protein n=1 Tax=Marmota monax TaxID=9995 RepID=A0A5E4AJ44_MARMO|nr:Hypothetical predicted protein [Marmota monax]
MQKEAGVQRPRCRALLQTAREQAIGQLHSDPGVCFAPCLSISVNGKVIACDGGCQGIIDTGTSLMSGPADHVLNIQKLIHAQPYDHGQVRGGAAAHSGLPTPGTNLLPPSPRQYVVDCDTIDALPDILFTINGVDYPVPASAYVRKVRTPSQDRPCHLGAVTAGGWDVDVNGGCTGTPRHGPQERLNTSQCP